MTNSLNRKRFVYGWYVLAGCFAILFFNAGARFSFGVVFKPIIAEFDWGRSLVSFVFFLNSAFYAVSLVFAGKLYDRYGPKWVIIVSTLFLAAGYILTSAMRTVLEFVVGYGFLAAVGLGGTSVPIVAALMSKWFHRWRGLAISLALSGNSVGQFVLIPLFSWYVAVHGWRGSYLGIGVIMLVLNSLIALLVIRGDPEDLGLRSPVGKDLPTRDNATPEALLPRDLGLVQAMRTRSFWLFTFVMFVCGSGDFFVTTHLIPLVTDHGISPAAAGDMLAWCGLLSFAGMLVAGPASDLIGNKLPIALTFAFRVFLFALVLEYHTATSFYFFALAFGFTYLITAPLTPTLIGRLYGLSHVGILSGFITTVHHLGGGLWTYLGGWVFDRTGRYDGAFILSAAAALLAFVASLLIAERRHGETETDNGFGGR